MPRPFSCFASVLLLAAATQAAEPAPIKPADVEAILRTELDKTWAPGCALAIVKGNDVVYSGAVGVANVEYQVAATPATVFDIGSVTKQFTAVLALMLADEGKLSLDDPLGKHLDAIPAEWKPITIRQCLAHQTGIASFTGSPEFRKAPGMTTTPEEFLARVTTTPLKFPPGEKYSYSNTNHLLVGQVLEKVTGKPYCDLVTERLTTPLGMTATRCADRRAILASRAVGYTGKSLAEGEHAEQIYVKAFGGSGALESNVLDLVKWDIALRAGKVIRPERVNQLAVAATLPTGEATTVGLGWVIEQSGTHRMLVAAGGHPGYNAALIRMPELDLTAVALINSDYVSAGYLAKRALSLWVADIFAASDPSADPDPVLTARLRKFLEGLATGTYDAAELSPEAATLLVGDPLQQAGEFLATIGKLDKLEILDRRPIPGGLMQVRYKASYEKLPLETTWIFTPDGKIADFGVAPL